MSTDEAVTKDLIQTLEDGKQGFAKGAEKLEESDRPDLATEFRRLSEQRSGFSAELREIASEYGDTITETGSMAGAVHRGWLTLRDALSGSDAHGVLAAAEQGEGHAVAEYDKALGSDISPRLKTMVERQAAEIRTAHDRVRSLADAKSSPSS